MYIVLSVQKPSPISFNSVLHKLSQDFLNIKVKKLPKMASSRENFFRLKIRFTSKSLLSPNLMATLPYYHLRWYRRRVRRRVRRLSPPPSSPPPILHLGLHRILNWPDIRPPDIRPICFAGYPVSGRISGLIV